MSGSILLCMDKDERERITKQLYDIPIELMYKGKGLVDINNVLEVFNDATRPSNQTVLLQQEVDKMRGTLQRISGRTV